ncbi:hypothetical protein K492DRAFT_176155 [Lichtheimia hyalospora FSU 10163]|nr:hypothetical protein K492DRAFT_176155 [Lichtheimia hyalospora FSU 10163]
MSNTESRGTQDTNSLMPPLHDSRSMNDSEETPVHGERMSTLPLPSMPWVENELMDEKRPVAATSTTTTTTSTTAASGALLNKALPSTPPLSPSSSTSETLVRNNSTRSSNSSHGMTATGVKLDIQDISSGPPIIPRSKTPPPLLPLVETELQQRKEKMIISSKTIFDSDDDEEYDEEDEAGLFFKDFSPDAPRLSTVLNKKKRASRKASSKKATTRMSKFDLMSFANHLHDNRLSVMQLRESRIALTEEDEQELIKLLEKRKSMANSVHQMPLPSDESIPAVPPLPSNAEKEHDNDATITMAESSASATQEDKAQNTDNNDDDDLNKDTKEQQDEKKEDNDTVSPSITSEVPLEQTTSSLLAEKEVIRKRRVRKSMSMDEIHRMQQAQEEKTLIEMEPIQEVEPSLSSSSTHKSNNNSKVAPPNITIKPSTSTPSIKSRHSESPKPSPRNKAIGLFGSLRQASRATPLRGLVRNLSTNASRLSRQASFTRSSTSNTYNNKFASSRATLATQNGDATDLSPAARAVMQHNDKQQRKKDSKKNNDEEQQQQQQQQQDDAPNKKSRLLTHLLAKAGKARRTKTVNMASSTTATKRRDKTKSKIVRRTIIYVPPDSLNFMKSLEKGDIDTSKKTTTTTTSTANTQDESSAVPPLPNDMMKRIQQYNEQSGTPSDDHHDELDSVLNYYDDESLYDYYRNRESSVPQLEGLELREMDDGTVEWGIVKKQGNRKSFFAHGMNITSNESSEQNGTTTPATPDDAHELEEDEEDEEKIEEHVLRLMGLPVPTSYQEDHHSNNTNTSPPPVPRRSPRRRMESSQSQHDNDEQDHRRAKHISTIHSRKDASTTDVYFAPQQTLPSLLQMIANTSGGDDNENDQEKKHASVEEQLDEVMRSFQPPTSVH